MANKPTTRDGLQRGAEKARASTRPLSSRRLRGRAEQPQFEQRQEQRNAERGDQRVEWGSLHERRMTTRSTPAPSARR